MRTRIIAFSLLLLAACSNPDKARMERGMVFARGQFVQATNNPIAMSALGSSRELGGSLAAYLAANMPANADLPRFQDGQPTEPWSVVLQSSGDTIVILGFGETLDRAMATDTVILKPRSM